MSLHRLTHRTAIHAAQILNILNITYRSEELCRTILYIHLALWVSKTKTVKPNAIESTALHMLKRKIGREKSHSVLWFFRKQQKCVKQFAISISFCWHQTMQKVNGIPFRIMNPVVVARNGNTTPAVHPLWSIHTNTSSLELWSTCMLIISPATFTHKPSVTNPICYIAKISSPFKQWKPRWSKSNSPFMTLSNRSPSSVIREFFVLRLHQWNRFAKQSITKSRMTRAPKNVPHLFPPEKNNGENQKNEENKEKKVSQMCATKKMQWGKMNRWTKVERKF